MSNTRIYLDNAATTPLDPEVKEAMMPYFETYFGNPSSIHTYGREARSAIEKSRKKVAELLSTSPAQIIFTSGGTEADNMALWGLVRSYNIKCIITSKIEHHAVLHSVEHICKYCNITIRYVSLDNQGNVDLASLENILKENENAIVSLMHANNEIGNLTDIQAVGELCKKYKAFFHSDTVQTMGHYPFVLNQSPVNAIVGSAHKFHGPKGVGFLYASENTRIVPFVQGGAQERNMRGGTENVASIIGMAKALEIAYSNLDQNRKHIEELKRKLIELLKSNFQDIEFNGLCDDFEKSTYKVVSASFSNVEMADMLLFSLDIKGIAVSGGSACNSGALAGSHVLEALYGADNERPAIRFSLSKFNTVDEIKFTIEALKQVLSKT
ncbi:MAG: cysteine desulfurase family protein [Bacteroidota bacterium]|nr:cysteine desulfurase family protein [Bacteroidota bacterium]